MNELLERRCVNIEKESNVAAERARVRLELENDMAQYLASGGKVTEIPSSHYERQPRLHTTINAARELERAEVIASIPDFLKSPKSRSGYSGVTFYRGAWIGRWDDKYFGKFERADLAAKAIADHLKEIGYKPS